MNAQLVMNEVSATGARFVIEGDDIGLTQTVPDELLLKAKTHKSEIRKILLDEKRVHLQV